MYSDEQQSNVGTGMIPCKKNCRCLECQNDRLRARIAKLEAQTVTDEQIERGYIAFVRAQAEQADSGQECPRVAFEIGLCAALQKGES